jgi:hypothetical protein
MIEIKTLLNRQKYLKKSLNIIFMKKKNKNKKSENRTTDMNIVQTKKYGKFYYE